VEAAMTSLELGNLIRERLSAAGLAQYLDEAKEQYLEFPDGFFAEVVLKDASKLSEAQRVVKSVEEELRRQGVELDAIVRTNWEVVDVDGSIMHPPQNGRQFDVTIQSGTAKSKVSVKVPPMVWATVKGAFNQGALRELGDDPEAVLQQIVREFVKLQLSYGGESYWDPILHPELVLDEHALHYLTMQNHVKAN
jgi:hypothetical protein